MSEISNNTKDNILQKFGTVLGQNIIDTVNQGLANNESHGQIRKRIKDSLDPSLSSTEKKTMINNMMSFVIVG